VSPEALSCLHHRIFNRREFRVMNDDRFNEIILESVQNRHDNNQYQDEDIEAEIQRRIDDTVTKLHNDFKKSKYGNLLEVFKAVPKDKKLAFYLTRLLAADNIYDIESFVAYGIGPILGSLKLRAVEEAVDVQPSKHKSSTGKRQSRAPRKSKTRSANASKPSSPSDSKPNTRRRSLRLEQQHSKLHGIRKPSDKTR
jgi:hypothetical protein